MDNIDILDILVIENVLNIISSPSSGYTFYNIICMEIYGFYVNI